MKPEPPRLQRGLAAEAMAARHLRQQGLRVLYQRYRCRAGEIDLVCSQGRLLVIVEVRYRGHGSRSRAIETLDHQKRRRIVHATQHFLLRHPRWQPAPLRFDVVAIDADPAGTLNLEWIKHAFEAC
jgi:putative endonuclease